MYVSWRHVMIFVKSSSLKVKSMNSSFIKNIYIIDIFYHFPQFEQSKSEVWKGKNLCACELIYISKDPHDSCDHFHVKIMA